MIRPFPVIKVLPQQNDQKIWFTTSEGKGHNHGMPTNKNWKWCALPNCTSCVQGYTDYLIWWYTGDLQKAIDAGKGGFGNAKNWFKNFRTSWPRGQEPKLGAIACYDNSNLGHVEIVVGYDENNVYLVGSNVNNKSWIYHSVKRNMYYSASMKFQGFIYNPFVEEIVKPVPAARDESKHQVKINVTNLRIRNAGSLDAEILGTCTSGIYNILNEVTKDGYRWFEIKEGYWVAFTDDWGVEYIPENELEKLHQEINRLVIKNGELEKENNSLTNKLNEIRKVLD